MEKLIQELEAFEVTAISNGYMSMTGKDKLKEILSLAKSHPSQDMPLAELAKRKGAHCIKTWIYIGAGFAIDIIDRDDKIHGHEGKNLEEAKAKARAYLEALPDSHPGAGDKGRKS